MVPILSSKREYFGMSRVVKPRGRHGRKQNIKPYGVHLVYAEGEKTEPLYVTNIYESIEKNQKEKQSKIEIKVNPKSGGRSTLKLVEFAENDVKVRRKNNEQIDHVWIFYDKDSFDEDDFDNAFHKIYSKNKNKYKNSDGDSSDSKYTRWHACWSNESFELWAFLHFANLTSALSRDDYISKIDKLLTPKGLCYEKNNPKMFDLLREHGDILKAVKYAKKLDDELANNFKKENPSTGVYLFIEYFKYNLELVSE